MKQKISTFFKSLNKTHIMTALIALSLIIPVVGYSLTIPKFTDYSPPGGLYITWGDYMTTSGGSTISSGNAVTEFPAWAAQYPYRAIFIGGNPASGALQGHTANVYIVYSKKNLTDAFTFSYLGDGYTKGNNDSGYIRAFIKKGAYGTTGTDNDIQIRHYTGMEMTSGLLQLIRTSNYSGYTYNSYNTIGDNVYFDFDFYYNCADEHQQGAKNLNVSGLRSITDIPYAYMIHCSEHGSSASAEGGSSSGGGSSGGGGSSSGGSGGSGGNYGEDYEYNGNDPWGNKYPSTSGGGGINSNRPDQVVSVPDTWQSKPDYGTNSGKYPWENDANIPEFNFDFSGKPYDIEGEGTTGERGGTWTIPEATIPKFNFTIPTPEMPNKEKFTTITFPDDLRFNQVWPPPYIFK